ncbi:MAG: hypothetical protein ACXQTR_06320 [Candidatus Methanospirareceae archaeon]
MTNTPRITAKNKLKKLWDKTSKLAADHTHAQIKFRLATEDYYGIGWDSLPPLMDNHSIIETLDYGTADLKFDEFDELVQAAIDNQEV